MNYKITTLYYCMSPTQSGRNRSVSPTLHNQRDGLHIRHWALLSLQIRFST
uniref:Uncharacterized protein n=1 Tax=Anguilla anguilla TaxID=7936 RepID=A0A0E9XC83_ANGAN